MDTTHLLLAIYTLLLFNEDQCLAYHPHSSASTHQGSRKRVYHHQNSNQSNLHFNELERTHHIPSRIHSVTDDLESLYDTVAHRKNKDYHNLNHKHHHHHKKHQRNNLNHNKDHHRRREDFIPIAAHYEKLSTTTTSSLDSQETRRLFRGFLDDGGRHDDLTLNTIPKFDDSIASKVVGQVGGFTYLPCRIFNLGDKSVSWVRNRDSHILTVDRFIFISDERFSARFNPATQTWSLQIKFVNDMDAGSYECQVSTEPKISRSVQLQVVHPVVTIPGARELHIESGSDVTIKCVIAKAIQPPPHVFWYHNTEEFPSKFKSRPGSSLPNISTELSVSTRRSSLQTPLRIVGGGTGLAEMTIRGVSHRHAGNYTCAPPGYPNASVTLHVLNDEHPAAIQDGTQSGGNSISTFKLVYHLVFISINVIILYLYSLG